MNNISHIKMDLPTLSLKDACIAALNANSNNLRSLLKIVENESAGDTKRLSGIIDVCIEGNERLVADLKKADEFRKPGALNGEKS